MLNLITSVSNGLKYAQNKMSLQLYRLPLLSHNGKMVRTQMQTHTEVGKQKIRFSAVNQNPKL